MKFQFKPAVLGMAIVVGLTGVGVSAGSLVSAEGPAAATAPAAAFPTNVLANPDWTLEIPAGQDIESLFDFATLGTDNVYFRTEQGESSFVVQALDRKNGDKNSWKYDFRAGTKMLSGGDLAYGTNGDVYFLGKRAEDKTHTLRAVSKQGKLKWTTPVEVEIGGDLHAMPNGDILLLSSVQGPKKAEMYTLLRTFGQDGKLKSEKKVEVSRILENGQVLGDAPTLQLYASIHALSKPILDYAIPKDYMLFYNFHSNSSGPAVYPLTGGGTVIEIYKDVKIKKSKSNEAGIGSKHMMVVFDAKGKKTLERPLADDETFVTAGSGYILQKGQTFEAYDANNKRTGTQTLEGRDLWMMVAPSGEVTVTSKKDGRFYALNAKTLSKVHEVDMNADAERVRGYSFYYAGKGELYMLGRGEKTVFRYTLK